MLIVVTDLFGLRQCRYIAFQWHGNGHIEHSPAKLESVLFLSCFPYIANAPSK